MAEKQSKIDAPSWQTPFMSFFCDLDSVDLGFGLQVGIALEQNLGCIIHHVLKYTFKEFEIYYREKARGMWENAVSANSNAAQDSDWTKI